MSRRAARPWLTAAALYASAVLFFHRDLWAGPGPRVLGGGFVGGVFAWEIAWFKSCLASWTYPLFTRQLMFPSGTALIVESPWTALLGAAAAAGLGVYRAINALFLFNYLASGLAAFALAYEWTEDAPAATLAGYFYMFSHYAVVEHLMGHLHESALYFLPLVFLGLLRVERRRPGGWALFSLGALGTTLASSYLTLATLGVGVPVFLAARWASREGRALDGDGWRRLAAVAAAVAALGALCYLPAAVLGPRLVGGHGFYSLSVLSFFDPPAWHPWALVQRWRLHTAGLVDVSRLSGAADHTDFAFRAEPENLVGFFPLSLLALLAAGAWARAWKGCKTWLAVAAAGLLLSLGPKLQWDYQGGRLWLPYAALMRLPWLSQLRAPARMIALTWVSASVLAAVSFQALTRRRAAAWRWIAAVLLAGAFSTELALWVLGRESVYLEEGAAYQALRADPAPGAVLELPLAISVSGEVSVNAERYMLQQPLHGRPLVVGRPARYTWDSLSFCEDTPYLFELTHPAALQAWLDQPRARRDAALRQGLSAMRKAGIRYVLLHTGDRFFGEDTIARYEAALQPLGAPVAASGGVRAFRLP